MFYDRFVQICAEHNVSPSKAAIEAGLSKSTVTYWKNNATAKPTGQIAERHSAIAREIGIIIWRKIELLIAKSFQPVFLGVLHPMKPRLLRQFL